MYSPWPVAFTYLNGKLLKIFSVELTDVPSFDAAGVVDTDGGIFVCCGDNLLKIKELQEEGGKKMTAKDFLLGRKIKKGDRFGNA